MEQELMTQEDNITTAELLQRSKRPDGRTEAPADHETILPDVEKFRARWRDVQAGFVDEPEPSVQKADQLVASVIQQLTEVFAHERSRLETDWRKGGVVSTEDLRQALRRYRSFFDRLLAM